MSIMCEAIRVKDEEACRRMRDEIAALNARYGQMRQERYAQERLEDEQYWQDRRKITKRYEVTP